MIIGIEQLRWAAQQLGLTMTPAEPGLLDAGVTLTGVVDGVYVRVEQWQGQFVHVEFTAYFDPPADLRLSIRTAGVTSKLGELLGRRDIHTGDAAFDAAFDVKADEADRARALLSAPVREALLTWSRSRVKFHLTDEGVFLLTVPGAYSTLDGADIVTDVRATAALARTVSEAIRAVPSSTLLASEVEAWRSDAGAHGLSFAPSPLRASGRLHGADFSARAVAVDDDAWGVEIKLRFESPLPWHLRVRPARWFDFLERTGEAERAKTGDAAFDDELRITTTDAARTKALLDDGVRAALLALHRDDGAVVLDADGLSVRTKSMTGPASFGSIVERVAAVAQKLQRRAGPFRT